MIVTGTTLSGSSWSIKASAKQITGQVQLLKYGLDLYQSTVVTDPDVHFV
jgi:hypothetical protein